MLMVNIAEAKAKLSEYIDAAAKGERVMICNRNKPVAELRAVDEAAVGPRDLTPMYPGETFITDAFYEPMTDDEIAEWYEAPVFPAASKVSEARATYGKAKKPRRK